MSGRPRKCRICRADFAIAARINSMLESHVHLKVITAEIPEFSVSQLSRHKNRCLLAREKAELTDVSGSAEHAKWLERAESTFLIAQSQGDVKSAAAAISVAVRALTAMHKRQGQEAAAAKAVTDERYSVQILDQRVKDFLQERDSKNGGVQTKAACLCEEELKFREIVQLIWADRRLLDTILIHAKQCATIVADGFIPPRETENATAND